ncbi:MAG: sulfatase-like hydrolase/transferase [Gammaproteobacteria bacterium]|nr:sulfatase-like hydrolase/transferase [Gammaproteobacteria bacterium]
MSKRPNFLFLITDQQRADWLGCYGHPVVKTPHIDSIASIGTRFENFYVAMPVCMPNRASLITGRYPSVHGLRYNGCLLPMNANTFVERLAESGYHTAAIGKSHLQPFTGLPPIRADDASVSGEAWHELQGTYTHEEPDRYTADGRYEIDLPYYGYQHVDMVTTHGDRCGGHYHQWFRENAPDWEALHDDANELKHNYSCPQAFRTPIPEELYPTAYIRNSAVDYLHSRASEDQPFFAFVSFPDPHHPFNPPGKYWDMYGPDEFELTLPYEAHKNPTPPMQWMHERRMTGKALTPQTVRMLDEQPLKEAMALTAGMVTCVDDAVGEILEALRSSGQFDNTVICYNSDHGDYLGDFNMLLKGTLPFKSITRVPFIWSDPKNRSAGVTQALASTVDIAPTILQRVGAKPFNGIQGKSLMGIFNGTEEPRDDLLIEQNDGNPRLGFESTARVRALVTPRWRYTLYMDQTWGELYDLENDPDETNNLWESVEHREVRAELAERLAHQLIHQMDESPKSTRIA